MKWLNDGISGISVIMLIITAGGVFKQVLTDSGTADYISNLSSNWHMPVLVFAWLVTALLRVTMGSATVAGITAAGIVSPLLAKTNVSPELLLLAVGSGSVFMSHVNDTAFWMFKEFFNLSIKQTFFSWTLMETTISFMGLIGVLILSLFINCIEIVSKLLSEIPHFVQNDNLLFLSWGGRREWAEPTLSYHPPFMPHKAMSS